MAAKNKPEPETPVAEGSLIVTGPEHGRWRAGLHFTATPRRVLASLLTEEQIEEIESDPLLRVKRS